MYNALALYLIAATVGPWSAHWAGGEWERRYDKALRLRSWCEAPSRQRNKESGGCNLEMFAA